MGGKSEEKETSGLAENRIAEEEAEDNASEKMMEEEGGGVQIPLHLWLMHGAVMFGREFCYAMETALVTPVLLQIGLPEQYYSLTWFLSPVLGLLLTPVIGSASDRCTLRWGRRRPFILALCVGVLLGVALFLNGSLIGLSIGDRPNNQPIGIVLTVVGVIVLDFCADATEGPIRAYLLDVAGTEEQDMALNIHAISAGLGGAVGYMLGGLDWTGTALGKAFKSQEQVLFLFASIIFIVSVILHMFSITEQPLTPSKLLKDAGGGQSNPQVSFSLVGQSAHELDVIAEEGSCIQELSGGNKKSDCDKGGLDYLSVDRVRSKSDSVLAMPDVTIEFDPDLDPDRQLFSPEMHFLPETEGELQNAFMASDRSTSPSQADQQMATEPKNRVLSKFNYPTNRHPSSHQNSCGTEDLHHRKQLKEVNGVSTGLHSPDLSGATKSRALDKLRDRTSSASAASRPRAQSFYRQPSFTFSYYGRVGSQRSQLRRTPLSPRRITASRSLNDLSKIQQHADRRELQLSAGSLSSKGSSSEGEAEGGTTVRLLWQSMFKMPTQLWRLCVCHLLTWFAYIAESVYYTDYMGQVIYNGDPTAETNSTELQNYHRGVQMGCWGLVVCAATAAVCSALLQKYLDNFDLSIKVVYIVGTLGFSIGTAVMAVFPNVYVAMVMISTMGIISMSMSYCPYALLGQYHEIKEFINHSPANTRRGFGIDCAILSCQVYVSQILVAAALGSVIEAVGSVRVVPAVASAGSFLGFLTACFLVIYPDMEPSGSERDLGLVGGEGELGVKTDLKRVSELDLTEKKHSQNTENHLLPEQ